MHIALAADFSSYLAETEHCRSSVLMFFCSHCFDIVDWASGKPSSL